MLAVLIPGLVVAVVAALSAYVAVVDKFNIVGVEYSQAYDMVLRPVMNIKNNVKIVIFDVVYLSRYMGYAAAHVFKAVGFGIFGGKIRVIIIDLLAVGVAVENKLNVFVDAVYIVGVSE